MQRKTSALQRMDLPRSAANRPAYSSLQAILQRADIRLNGHRPWDMRVHDPGVPARVLAYGNLGLGESYMDGQWDCDAIDQLFDRLLRTQLDQEVRSLSIWLRQLQARWLNLQTEQRAWRVGRQHYDLGNDFYTAMLGQSMAYTCAFWQNSQTLDAAQEHKLDLVCRKLGLQPGMRVLDIGCGWGSFMRYAAQRYGVQCVGVTISEEQAAHGRQLCAGLPVEFRLADYRSLDERFDRIVSIGMFEHVGRKNYQTYMDVALRCLASDGLFMLHTIGRNDRGYGTDPWIHRYIFPNGELPSMADIAQACEHRFVVEDLHNFGADYDRTLMAWHANVQAAWPRFAEQLGPRFLRMWRYYLLSCAGAFRARDIQLWQWVLSRPGRPGVYPRLVG